MSVITYCQQKNPLRICTKPHIRLCYAWSSQRFKSLPSILCKIAVCTKPVTWWTPVISVKTLFRPAIWTGVAGWNPVCFLVLFAEAKRINPSPFRELSIAWKACPCRGSTLRVLWSFEVLQTSNQRTQVAVSHRPIKFLPLRGKYKRHVKRVVFCRKSSWQMFFLVL